MVGFMVLYHHVMHNDKVIWDLHLCQQSGVPWDHLLDELVFLRPLISGFELYETCMLFLPRLYDPDVVSTLLLTEGHREVPFSCLSVEVLRFLRPTCAAFPVGFTARGRLSENRSHVLNIHTHIYKYML